MKNIIILLWVFLITPIAFAQNFSGYAIYEEKRSSKEFEQNVLADPKMDPKMKALIEAKMKKMFEKTFILNFDKNSTLYKEDVKLDVNSQPDDSWSPYGIVLEYYQNIKSNQAVSDTDLMGKQFIVKDSLPKFAWKLESETKKIGNYQCHKAIAVIPVSKKEREDYLKELEEQKKQTTQFLKVEEPKEKVITAWYTPDIPLNHGPENYWGLPGLILEIINQDKIILCSKVVLNPKEKNPVKEPSKGEIISREDFNLLVQKKMRELETVKFGNN